jgi:DNA-binding transcriptional LysR family regulator
MSKRALNAQGGAGPAQQRAGLDWGHLEFFLELVRTGSHARAARRLGVDRNTVARRVAALEGALGLALFERGPQGWACTTTGQELAELASRVEQDVLALARHADTRDRALEGTVRLTTASHLATHLFLPAVGVLRERHPGLVREIAADQRAFDLTRREADLAVRMGRPRDAGLVTRKLSDVAYGLYGGRAAAGGKPRAVDFASDPFVGLDEGHAAVPQERWLERVAPARRIVFRCNGTTALIQAARLGLGVAVLPRFVADRDAALVRLEGPEPAPHELWLLVHGDLRRTPRVRAVIDWLDGLVERARPALSGQA